MSIIIVQTTPKFWKTIKAEVLKLEKTIFGAEAFDEEPFSTFENPKAYNLIVYSGGRIIGYMMSERLSDSEVHNGMKHRKKIFYLESIGLLPQYQGRGIGKQLFEKYLNYGKRSRCTQYLLDTKEKPMIKLAQRYGFRITRYNKKQLFNGKKWAGAYIMKKDLGGKK